MLIINLSSALDRMHHLVAPVSYIKYDFFLVVETNYYLVLLGIVAHHQNACLILFNLWIGNTATHSE